MKCVKPVHGVSMRCVQNPNVEGTMIATVLSKHVARGNADSAALAMACARTMGFASITYAFHPTVWPTTTAAAATTTTAADDGGD